MHKNFKISLILIIKNKEKFLCIKYDDEKFLSWSFLTIMVIRGLTYPNINFSYF